VLDELTVGPLARLAIVSELVKTAVFTGNRGL